MGIPIEELDLGTLHWTLGVPKVKPTKKQELKMENQIKFGGFVIQFNEKEKFYEVKDKDFLRTYEQDESLEYCINFICEMIFEETVELFNGTQIKMALEFYLKRLLDFPKLEASDNF